MTCAAATRSCQLYRALLVFPDELAVWATLDFRRADGEAQERIERVPSYLNRIGHIAFGKRGARRRVEVEITPRLVLIRRHADLDWWKFATEELRLAAELA